MLEPGVIVLTNDDGVDAPGLAALRAATEGLGDRLVMAPLGPQSGCGHVVGADIHHSGTVAAVREAALHGLPGVAVSHYIARGRTIDWDRAVRWLVPVLRDLMARPPEPGTFWNVNLPHPEPGSPDPAVTYCPVDPSPLPLAFRQEPDGLKYCGDYQGRARSGTGDVAVCFGGRIAVSKVHVMASVWPLG